MTHSTPRLIAALFSTLLTALAFHPVQAQEIGRPGQVAVSGKQLMRDGRPWTPHGFFQIAFAVPPGAFNLANANPVFVAAYQNYSPAEYSAMRETGADSVRMNVAQDGADPKNANFFDPKWLEKVIGAIHAARRAGLTVIVSIQDETQTGVKTKAPLPDDATRRVWRELAPIFGQDRGVLFELYNEPNLGGPLTTPPTNQQWQEWAAAMNKTLSLVRALGAVNVVVADGLASAQQLSGAPVLNDPLHQVAYASHPYANSQAEQTLAAWKEKFGDFAQTAPVIVTEWGVGYFCDSDTPASVVEFLKYLQEQGVGLEAVAWDWNLYNFASAVQGFPNTTFSSLLTKTRPTACSAATSDKPGTGQGPGTSYGPGKTIERWYLTRVPPTQPE